MHLFPVILDRNRAPIRVLVAQFSHDQSFASLFDSIYADPANSRRSASAIILRPCVSEHFSPDDLEAATRGSHRKAGVFLDAVAEASEQAPGSFARFEDIPVFVLHSDHFALRLSGNINPGAPLPPLVDAHLKDPTTLDAIRSREFDYLVAHSRALLMPVEGAYYDPPSHRPIRSFLRIGNIQYSRQAIDALGFWLLPHVAKARGLLIDTWSISSIAFNLSRVLTLYDGRPPIPVEMLSRYQDRSPEAQATLLEVLDRLWGECPANSEEGSIPITCIVSATQSGSLVDVLQDQIDLACLPIDMSFVALFQLGTTDALPSLCDRSNASEFAPIPPESVEVRSAIHIDPQVYFPLVFRDMEIVLRKPQAKSFAAFIERFGTESLFSAHRDQASDGAPRHHAVHLNMPALIANEAFGAAFDAQIRALVPPPKIVLTPQHDAARSLGERAIEVLAETGHQAILIQHPSLLLREEGPSRDAEIVIRSALSELGVADSLLILDDCFITGDRLTSYQTRLRQLDVRARLHYRVGVARPDDLGRWKQCQAMLAYRDAADREVYADNTVDAVEVLCLPNWQEPDCPWCAEQAIYHRMLMEGQALPAAIHQRLQSLADRNTGLENDLFLVSPADESPHLYSGSIFAPPGSSEATVFAAVASALQQLRTDRSGTRPALGPRRYPIATILPANEYLKEVYTDTILRAAMLRAACVEELVYMDELSERRRTEFITALITSSSSDERNITLELILAHAARKCMIDIGVGDSELDAVGAALLANVRALPK